LFSFHKERFQAGKLPTLFASVAELDAKGPEKPENPEKMRVRDIIS